MCGWKFIVKCNQYSHHPNNLTNKNWPFTVLEIRITRIAIIKWTGRIVINTTYSYMCPITICNTLRKPCIYQTSAHYPN